MIGKIGCAANKRVPVVHINLNFMMRILWIFCRKLFMHRMCFTMFVLTVKGGVFFAPSP